MTDTPDQPWTPLVDVSGFTLTELIDGSDSPALRQSIARVVRDIGDPNGVISAFSAFASKN